VIARAPHLALSALPLLLGLARAHAQEAALDSGGVLIPEEAAYDVQHYSLALDVDPARKSIEGTLKLDAVALAETQRIALDLDQRLSVRGVRGARPLSFEHREGRIWIAFATAVHAGDAIALEVAYGGVPREAPHPPWEGGFTWAKTADGRPWIATSCQGEGADLWWPCKDHPSDKPNGMDLAFTLPKGLVCASNGTLAGEETQGEKTTWRWRVAEPISNYGIALNAAPYEVLRSSFTSVDGTAVPVFFYALPEDADKARARLPELIDHLRFFERRIGPYPFRAEKYGVAETPHLGMEHQTIIAYGYGFRHDAFGYDWLHHHEASHEWWGNLVTCSDWKDMWLHEGFGTYMQALYVEELSGKEGLKRWLQQTRSEIRNRRPVAPVETQTAQGIYFDTNGDPDNDIYSKGALVLHTLRWHLGDEAFFKALKTFAYPDEAHLKATDGSQVRLVDTEDFRRTCEAVSGQDLGWFFEVFLRRPELPKLHVTETPGKLTLRWGSSLDAGMTLAVPVRVGKGPDAKDLILHPAREGETFDVAGPVQVDPDLWLLAEIVR
jgi:aminopeptidase N